MTMIVDGVLVYRLCRQGDLYRSRSMCDYLSGVILKTFLPIVVS